MGSKAITDLRQSGIMPMGIRATDITGGDVSHQYRQQVACGNKQTQMHCSSDDALTAKEAGPGEGPCRVAVMMIAQK